MALSLTQDVTAEFNANNGYVADASNWDYLIWQFVTPTGTINLTATNDAGSITGSFDGNSLTATNFATVSATVLNGGALASSVSASGLYRTQHVGQFVKFGGDAAQAAKVIVQFHKFS
jgi:hypothetical protein